MTEQATYDLSILLLACGDQHNLHGPANHVGGTLLASLPSWHPRLSILVLGGKHNRKASNAQTSISPNPYARLRH
jgi:hypothetical protein